MITILKAAEAEKNKPKEVFEEFTLIEKKPQTSRITSFIFSKPGEGKELDPGCFVRLKLPNGILRSYSIVGGTTHRFQLGVALDDQSRGGSKFLHESLNEGDKILVGKITESVPIPSGASNHIFIVGGIGITAFLGHIDIYSQINYNYTLHYAVRSAEEVPFKEEIVKMGDNAIIYDRSKGERMDIEKVLRDRVWNSQVYTCGPQRMIEDVERVAGLLGVDGDEIHYEAFQANNTGDPFSVEVVREGEESRVLDVPGDKTLLTCIREAGLEIDSSCEVGNCGACKVVVREGTVEHRKSVV